MCPIRVLQISRVSEGGVATVVEQIAKGLNRHKYKSYICFVGNVNPENYMKYEQTDIEIIEFKKAGRMDSSKDPIFSAPGVNIQGWIEDHLGKAAAPFYSFLKSLFFFLKVQIPEVIRFLRLIKEHKIDLIHTHSDTNFNKPEVIAAKLSGIPSISHLHAYTRMDNFDRIFCTLVGFYIYISRDIERYHRVQGKSPQKGWVIYNGIDMDRFISSETESGLGCYEDISSDGISVGIVGRIDCWKGHDFFIKALPSIRNRFPEIKALIVGSVARNANYFQNKLYQKSLGELVVSLNLEKNVTFTGYRGDIPEIIAKLDILVHASSQPEPFGLVIIEGMASGKPVVATAAGGVLEIIKDNVNGMLVPCEDSQAIARAIIELLTDKEKANKIAASGRRTVAEKFTSDRQVSHIENLYQCALNNG